MVQVAPSILNSPVTLTKSKKPKLLSTKVILARCLLMVFSGGLASGLGWLLACWYPHPQPTTPWLIQLSNLMVNNVAVRGVSVTPNLVASLTEIQQQQFRAEIAQLEQQLQLLRDRMAQLESQLQLGVSNAPLEQRLVALRQQLQGNSAAQLSQKAAKSRKSLKITLPSDVLFVDASPNLAAEAHFVLDSIIEDLQGADGGTIQIGVTANLSQDSLVNRELSLQRAKAVQIYLRDRTNSNYRWVLVGYGQGLSQTAVSPQVEIKAQFR